MFRRKLSVAPMMQWTDRHCRHFHRQYSDCAQLYTEMVTSAALVHGNASNLLDHDLDAGVVLQLGGSDPSQLAQAVKIAASFKYDEINLNVGCPSDRVQSGSFGAVLMKQPELVADCCAAMKGETDREITVKCRIGVDDQNPKEVLPQFLETVARAGVSHFIIHARMAWLQGLSPKENRDVPPLDYDLVLAMKKRFPALCIAINGGITSLDQAQEFLNSGLDGVMVGRTAYHNPSEILSRADSVIFRQESAPVSDADAVTAMLPYIETELTKGARLNQITRHMLGAFAGRPGARLWRRVLSEGAYKPGAGPELVVRAMQSIGDQVA